MYKPRQSGIPTPGRPSGIPTPGRSRSSSVAGQNAPAPQHDVDAISRAFAEAIKANDPSQHRNSRASDMSSVASLSPPAASFSGSSRPSSVASVSRPKTPSYARPLSRQSERSSSRAGTRPFELGDNVRVESLGFEGALRFIGEIDGKPGLWAGVELSGGFAGKGKNDGSVGGKQYFSCPAKCGVFVATTKLSAPTVGFGASHRPSSVSGRITPGLNGRMTPSTSFRSTTSSRPSLSNGRITPSGRVTPANNGRITPSSVSETPSARAARLRALAKKPTTSLPPVPSVSKTPTPGTRASKYASMTAKQLSTIHGTPDSKIASPGGIARSMSSPIRSPFATPKPRIPTSGPGTPRARIPSAVAMPPPPAPSSPSRSASASLNGTGTVSAADLDQRSRELQARIASLTGASRASEDNDFSATEVDLPRYRTPSAPSSPRRSETTSPRMPSSPRRPQSSFGGPTHRATSSVSSITNERVDALLDENERLRSDLERMKEDVERAKEERENDQHTATLRAVAAAEELEKLNEEKRQVVETSQTRITELEAALKAADDAKTQLTLHHSTSIAERDQAVKDLEATKGGLEIDVGKLKKTVVDLEDERHDLLSQVDELRQAGQETIALYEERLRACDVRRYELEDNIADLEARVREAPARDQSVSPSSTAATLVSGTEIDNETLRDQIIHLQKKIATLEDIIEDSRAAAEKEEAALRDRMRRVKEKEDAMRREVNESKREVQMGIEREEMAKRRTEEVEEAFRESTVALENARAEVEGLRVDLDHLNGLVSSASEGSMSSKVQEITNRASMDKDEYTGEIARLRQLLDDAQATGDSELIRKNEELQEMAEEQILKMSELQEKIEDQAQELDALKKKLNRDVTINAPGTPSKHDLSAARDEIKGLKHIVRQLQEEAVVSSQKQKTLESENQLLMSEMDQLRQEVKILEENIDQSIMREEAELSGAAAGTDVDIKALKLKFETETEQLRKRMTDAEMKTARVTHDLNKEISELEALVETKIYREDELEQEIDRLKDKLSRKKSSSSSSYAPSTYHAGGSTTSLSSSNGTIATNGEPVCEICERPGHDIFNCDLLKEGSSTPSAAPKVSKEELFCEDCEGYGHLPVDCPHSADVF